MMCEQQRRRIVKSLSLNKGTGRHQPREVCQGLVRQSLREVRAGPKVQRGAVLYFLHWSGVANTQLCRFLGRCSARACQHGCNKVVGQLLKLAAACPPAIAGTFMHARFTPRAITCN